MKPGFFKANQLEHRRDGIGKDFARARAAGMQVLDLTASTRRGCALEYDAAQLLQPLADASALDYDPDPRECCARAHSSVNYYASHWR